MFPHILIIIGLTLDCVNAAIDTHAVRAQRITLQNHSTRYLVAKNNLRSEFDIILEKAFVALSGTKLIGKSQIEKENSLLRDKLFLTAANDFLHQIAELHKFLLQITHPLYPKTEESDEENDVENERLLGEFKQFAIKKHLMERRAQPFSSIDKFTAEFIQKCKKLDEDLRNEFTTSGKTESENRIADKLRGLFARPLRQFFYGNELNQKVQIRVSKALHVLVLVGDYEYDYVDKPKPPRRQIYRKWSDSLLPEGHKLKAAPFSPAALGTFDTAFADQTFFDMMAKGFTPENFGGMRRHCMSFIYEFVAQLNGGQCLGQEEFPQRFVENHIDSWGWECCNFYSLFSPKYAHEDHPEVIKYAPIPKYENGEAKWTECTVQYHFLEFVIGRPKNDGQEEEAIKLPAFVAFDTGIFVGHHTESSAPSNLHNCSFKLAQPTKIEEYLILKGENATHLTYNAVVPARTCTVGGKQRVFVNNLAILDGTVTKILHAFGAVDLLNAENSIFLFNLDEYNGEFKLCKYNQY